MDVDSLLLFGFLCVRNANADIFFFVISDATQPSVRVTMDNLRLIMYVTLVSQINVLGKSDVRLTLYTNLTLKLASTV